MKTAKLSLVFAMLAIGVASAATACKVTLLTDLSANGVSLKAGIYKVEMAGNQATFTQGRQTIQVPASVENNPSKFRETTLETSGTTLAAIDVGGTATKIVFTAKK